MKIIHDLEELIEEEIHDVKKYAKMAAEIKHEHPGLSHVLYSISAQEEEHQALLHSEVVKLIENYRKAHGTAPPEMQAIYDFMHKRHIDKLAEARRYQEIYKTT